MKLKGFIERAFQSLNTHYDSNQEGDESTGAAAIKARAASALTGSAVLFKAKFGYRFSKLTDKLLRQME